jgi:hypothetical protein
MTTECECLQLIAKVWLSDNQHVGAQHNDIQHNDIKQIETQHKNIIT